VGVPETEEPVGDGRAVDEEEEEEVVDEVCGEVTDSSFPFQSRGEEEKRIFLSSPPGPGLVGVEAVLPTTFT